MITERNPESAGKIIMLALSLLTGIFVTGASAQYNLVFDHIFAQDGLTDASVRSIIEDHEGFIWFGTNNGLNRYDGYEIKKYYPGDSNHSLNANIIYCLYEDTHNNLWIGTWGGGLSLYNPEQDNFTNFMHDPADPGSIRHNDVWDIFEDSRGNLWICTQKGLDRYDYETGTFEKHLEQLKLPEQPLNLRAKAFSSIVEGADSTLWISIWKYGILNYDPVHRQLIRHLVHQDNDPESISTSEINTLYVTDKGDLWIGTYKGGLEKLHTGKEVMSLERFTKGPADDQLTDDRINFILEDHAGNLWVGTGNGLNILDQTKETFSKYYYNAENGNSLSGNSLLSAYQSRNNIIWIGSLSSGVNKYDPWKKKFSDYYTVINNANEQNKKFTKSIFRDSRGILWIGTDFGLNRIVDDECKTISYSNDPEDAHSLRIGGVTGILEQDKSHLWVSTWGGGLHLFDKVSGTFRRLPVAGENLDNKSLSDGNIRTMVMDNEGKLLIGTTFGYLDIFDPVTEKFEHVLCYDVDSIHGVPVVALAYDPSGIVWIGLSENGGVIRYDRKTKKMIRYVNSDENRQSLTTNDVLCMLNDRDNLWVGTKNGLNLIHKATGKISVFNNQDGLPDKSILSIQKDADGFLWISTLLGLSKFNYQTGEIYNYDTRDGALTGCSTSFNDHDSVIYFGGVEGVYSFSPSSIRNNPFLPPVVISGFSIFNEPVLPGTPGSPINKSISKTTSLNLNYRQTSFSFDFAALNYTLSQKNKYQYMLQGFDKGWIHAGNRRTAYYTNVNPGEYVFMVKGSNNDGIWNPVPEKIDVQVLPPPWKTWWAYSLYFIFIVLALIVLRRFIVSSEKLKSQLILEKMEHEKAQELSRQNDELNKMKLRFFTNISHEFRTPLTLIIGPLEKILDRTRGSELEDSILLIQRNSQALLRLINQLLDLSKIETGFAKPSVSEGDIVYFIRSIASAFNLKAERLKMDYRFTTSIDSATGWFDEEKLEKILYNLLSNAFKFTPEGGRISIGVRIRMAERQPGENCHRASRLEVAVTDTGKGIPASERSKIFNYFYRPSGSNSTPGSGIGLALVFQLVKVLRGELKYSENPEGRGSTFTVQLPVEKTAFNREERISKSLDVDAAIREIHLSETPVGHPTKKRMKSPVYPDKHRPTVLIVDDHADVRKYLRQSLEGLYNISEAKDGREAFKITSEILPDLIVSDVMMPRTDGLELCRNIKKDEKTSHIPIILLTAKSGMENKIEGTLHGADEYIEKPFDLHYLRAKIESLLLTRKKLREAFGKKFSVNTDNVISNSIDNRFLEKLISHIQNNLDNPDFSVDDIVLHVGMSRAQLYRKLKSVTNQSVNDFVQNIRLNQAGKLLLETDQTVAEICYQVGFKDPSYFTKCFRKKFRCLPSEFSKKYLQSNI